MENNEIKVKKWLTDEVKFILQFGTVLVAIVLGWSSLSTEQALLKQQLNRIETNDLVHVQEVLDKIMVQHEELLKNVVKIQTIIEQQ